MRKQKLSQLNTNKGFTLVELIVVLVLFVILLAISIAGLLTWQDWSRFKKENTAAETIFYAAQNQLSELSATGVYKEKVVKVIGDKRDLLLDSPEKSEKEYFNGSTISYGAGNNDYYKWQPTDTRGGTAIWANTPQSALTPEEREKYQGRIYCLRANANDYNRYINGEDFGIDPNGTKLLFDLITPYISDKSVLNGAINLEFSPEAMQVFSVCYSDRTDSLTYDEVEHSKTETSVLDRSEGTRQSALLGYFAADSLSIPLEGKSIVVQDTITLVNAETLHLIINEDELDANREYNVELYKTAGKSIDTSDEARLMSFKFRLDNTSMNNDSWAEAAANPTEVEATFSKGTYENDPKKLRIPIMVRDNPRDQSKKQIVLILDAADVQAQSYLYADGSEAPYESFLNTYSFYRYGFNMKEITRVGCVVSTEDNPSGASSNTECPTFEEIKDSTNGKTYAILNGRHLYNVRFETDYKDDDANRTFLLKDDIDWGKFTGAKGGIDYYLDSYKIGGLAINGGKAGIDYDGSDHTINQSESLNKLSSNYAFPGFRSLGKNDIFTGLSEDAADDETPYTISNLTITFAGNMTYGVYGKASRDEWVRSLSNGNITPNITQFGQYNNGVGKHPTQVKAMKGELPLGLFAENSGTITNLTLNAHKVIGMEEMTLNGNSSVLIYTNMVGGFTGDNLGVLSNLTLRDVSDLGDEDTRENEAGVTFINGKTDIGGILGRQSWSLVDTYVVLKNLKNYGKVTGMENIGGIVGRAYVIREFDTQGDDTAFNNRKAYYEDGYSIYGQYVLSDHKATIDPGNSITGKKVFRAEEIKIEDCSNRGRVAGDELVATSDKDFTFFEANKSDVSNTYRRCSNIGGIAGITMDGYFIENTAILNGKTWYGHHTGSLKVQLKNCDSYRLYTEAEFNSIVSKTGGNIGVSGQNRDIRNSIEHDFYVGGLVGYARMTYFENCSNEPKNADQQLHSFVFGRNYVGGLFGCFDGSDIPATVGSRYQIENYTNAIGIMFVGGFAGSSGIGDGDIKSLNFKRPSTNEGSQSTMIPGDIKELSGICNHGAVLAVRRDILDYSTDSIVYKQDSIANLSGVTLKGSRAISGAPDASVGGVIGIAASDFNNLDSEQSVATKNLVLQLVGFNNYSDGEFVASVGLTNAQTLVNTQAYSFYGGNAVGGIVGKVRNGVVINSDKRSYCRMNSVVWGFDGTGGIFGTAGTDLQSEKDKDISVYNTYVDGGLVLGRDTVGGIAGRGTSNYNNDENIVNPEYSQNHNLHVVGRYGAGGAFGFTGINAVANRTIVANLDGTGVNIRVEALAVAGGYAGIINTKSTLSGNVKAVTVNADYYAGGAFGAVYTLQDRAGLNRDVSVENVAVEANVAFAGGYVGLYGSNSKLSNNRNDFCLIYQPYYTLTGYGKNDGNPLILYFEETLKSDSNRTDLYTLMNTIEAAETDSGIFNAGYSDRYAGYSLSNNVTLVNSDTTVKAKIFAGGLFGYIPKNMWVTLTCPATAVTDQVQTTSALITKEFITNSKYNKSIPEECQVSNDNINTNNDGTRLVSYAGGIVGKIPSNFTITNAGYQGKLVPAGSYIGQIAEVNCGKVEGSKIYTYVAGCSKPTFTGGLVGLNSASGSFGANNKFVDNNTLGGDGYTVVGGLCGENIGTISADSIGAFSNPLQMKATTAAGLLVGYNGKRYGGVGLINTLSTASNKVLSANELSARYVGVYAGINAGTIYNSKVQEHCKNGTLEEINYIINNIPDNTGYSVNANLLGKESTYAGLIAGKNIGTISNIFVKSDGSKQKGVIKTTNAYTYLGGLVGQNGDGSYIGTIEECANTMPVGNATNTATAAGIAGTVNGKSSISKCIQYGTVNATTNAGGIAGIAEPADKADTIQFNDCVNLGTLSGDSASRAGIAVTTGGKGVFTLCRNYGSGAQFGISAENVLSMEKCLESSGLNEGTETELARPLAPNDEGLARNFYVWGTTDNVTIPEGGGDGIPKIKIPMNVNAINVVNSIDDSSEIWTYESQSWEPDDFSTIYLSGACNAGNAILELRQGTNITWKYIRNTYYNGSNEEMNSQFLLKLFAYYKYWKQKTVYAVTLDEFTEYVNNVIAKGVLEPKESDLPSTFELELIDKKLNADADHLISEGALSYKLPGDDYEAWKKYKSESADINRMIEEDTDIMLYYLYHFKNVYDDYGENGFRELVGKIYGEYMYTNKDKDGFAYDYTTFVNHVKTIFKGGNSGGDTTPDNSHWPVQLYYYGEDGTKGLYFKRKYYHFAGITLDIDPMNSTEAIGRFEAIDAQFKTMANDTDNYPNSSADESTTPIGFVKQ